ncbi:MAG: roadblock/LC7 domain-containing protein [bacterium]
MMQRVSEILKDMKGKASAEAALLTSSDGLVLGAVQDDGIELESLAAYAASNMMTSERMGESVDCGMPESVIVIYQDRAIVMAPLGPVVAILIGSSVTQLGNLRLQLKHAMVDLSVALRDELEMKAESQQAPAMAPEAAVEEIAALPQKLADANSRGTPVAPKPAPQLQKTSVDPELNGNGRRTVPPTRRGSSINLK